MSARRTTAKKKAVKKPRSARKKATAKKPHVLSANEVRRGVVQRIDVPEMNGVVYVRQLPASFAMDWAEMPDAEPQEKAVKKARQLELVALALTDEHGEPLFREDEVSTVAGNLSVGIVFRVLPIITAGMGVNIAEDGTVVVAGKTLEVGGSANP